MRTKIVTLLFSLASPALIHAAIPPFEFIANKNIITDALPIKSITLGESSDIFGVLRTQPGVYLKDNGDTYTAQRLTVVPPQTFTRWKPYLQVPTATSIIVSWKSETNEAPVVRYGTSENELNQTANGTNETLVDNTATIIYNNVKLENLTPDTKFYYKISGDDTVYSFHTQPEIGSDKNLRILILGDHQIINRSGYEWLFNAAKETVEKKYGKLEENIDLVLNPGDQVDRGTYNYYERCHFYKSSFFSPNLPIMTTLGNHEGVDDADFTKYQKLFSYQNLSYKGINSGTDLYYAIQSGRTLFVFLCTESSYTNDTQLNWLKSILAAANTDETVDFVMTMCHRPMCSETYIADYSEWLRNKAAPVLGSCPKHVLNVAAHHHYYQRGQSVDFPFYHIISGGASWDQTWAMAPTKFDDNLTQKTMDYWTYQIINFNPKTKKMDVETYSIGNVNLVHNNILIDRFERDLASTAKPEKPSLGDIPAQLNLPASVSSSEYRSAAGDDFNSCQFQIAFSSDFQKTIIDKIFHFENFFEDSGKPNYLPVNTQKDKSCFQLPLGASDLTTGRYYVRVRHRNQNQQWSDWSESKQFVVINEADKTPQINIDYEMYRKSDKIRVTYKNAPVGTGAWVGIYEQGVTPGGSTKSTKWASTSGADNYIDFSNTPVGKYYVVLFGTGQYGMITPKYEFEVIDGELAELQSDKVVYAEREPITVTYKNAPGNYQDWIAIYKVNETMKPGDAKYSSTAYLYPPTGSTEGSMTFDDKKWFDKLTPGNYFIGLFLKYGYNETARRVHIVVGEPLQLLTLKNSYSTDEYVEISMAGIPSFPKVWLTIKNKQNLEVVERIAINSTIANSSLFRKFDTGQYLAEIQFDDLDKPASNAIEFSVVSASGLENISAYSGGIYPNPVKDRVNINIDGVTSAEIYQIDGTFIACKNLKNGQLDLSALSSGSYLLIVNTPDKKHQYTIIKN